MTFCRLTAAHVAGELLGDSKAFDYQPFFYSRVFSLSWQVGEFSRHDVPRGTAPERLLRSAAAALRRPLTPPASSLRSSTA